MTNGRKKAPVLWFALLSGLTALLLLVAGSASVAAQERNGDKESLGPVAPAADQVIPGTPLNITIDDFTRMSIKYSDPNLFDLNGAPLQNTRQFYGDNAEGVYVWATAGGVVKVFGPPSVPAGNSANPYTPVSNSLTGVGTPQNPWVITTVADLPGANLRLTRKTTYVNGAEFVDMKYTVQQTGGSGPVNVSIFHAADLYTANNDSGFSYYDPTSGAVGSYYSVTTSSNIQRRFYQQFVPTTPATAYQEARYSTIWNNIGNASAPGPGFNNTIFTPNTLHDAGAGLQWDRTVPAGGSVTVGDIDLFSLNRRICGSFSDVPTISPFYDSISCLACNGIVSGYGDTTFRPNNDVTRGQLAKMVSNSSGYAETPTGQRFQDVPPGSPFYLFVERLTLAGRDAMGGYPCGTVAAEPCGPASLPYFRPNANATRGQISKIISQARGYNDTPSGQLFTDVPPGSTFYTFIQRLASRGIVGGYADGTFRPNANATRGQATKFVTNAFSPTCPNQLP